MPTVEIIFPGIPTDYLYHDPETGSDEQMVEWTFTAVVDGTAQTVSGVFAQTVSQDRAAYWIKDNIMLAADESESGGAVGTIGSTGGVGGGDSAGGIPGTSGSGTDVPSFPQPNKMKTEDGT